MREYPNEPRVGVCAAVIRGDDILLVKRGIPPSEGLWAMPGGSVKLGEILKDVAERETLEETGVVVRAGEPACVLDFVERDGDGRIRFHFVIAYIRCDYAEGVPAGGSDAEEARWFRMDDLENAPITPHTARALQTMGIMRPGRFGSFAKDR